MMPANTRGVTLGDDGGVVGTLVIAKWLHLAAAPTFTIMALLTAGLDSGPPNALCSAAGHFRFGGMAPMYLLMSIIHLTPWLNLMSRRRNVSGMPGHAPS